MKNSAFARFARNYRMRFAAVASTVALLLVAVFYSPLVHGQQQTATDPGSNQANMQADAPKDVPQAVSSPSPTELLERATTTGSVRVIVGLSTGFLPEGSLTDQVAVRTQQLSIAEAKDSLMSQMTAFNVTENKEFTTIPYLAMEVDAEGLKYLLASPEVSSVQEDQYYPALLAESVPLVGATAAWAAGYTGAGQTVAILDTGVDKNHPFLTGKVVSEACYSTTATGIASTCPGGVTQSTEVGSGVNCAAPGCEHGTHVAGIAAGKSATFSGVARDANIIAIQLASRSTSCTTGSCVGFFTSDIIRGLERVYALRNTFNIAAVNMSLGGGLSTSNCDASQTATKMAIDNLRSVGIATIIASGNNGSSSSISSPACISSAISVGSTGDGSTSGSNTATLNAVSSFSNSAAFLHLLAPGQYINSSIPGSGFANFSGTSMATPHVVGAWAVLKSKTPDASVSQILMALQDNGLAINDPRNNLRKPRIRVDTAVTSLSNSACNFTLSATSQAFPASGGTATVNVATTSGCQWSSSSNVPWATVTASGSGNGQITITVAANPAFDRSGTLFIAGQSFFISQAGIPSLAVDDGSFETATGLGAGGNSFRVNRLTPASYPATINAVAIFFPSGTGLRVGDPFNVVVGVNAGGTSNIDGTPLTRIPATIQTLGQFNVYQIGGVTANRGDFVAGLEMNHAAGVIPFALDTTPPQRGRSYRSLDGFAFVNNDLIAVPGNYGMRALVTTGLSCPTVASLSPATGIITSTVTITGTGFTGVTAVRFANNAPAQFTVNSDTQITATVPTNAVTGRITLSRPNCADVVTGVFTVSPCLTIAPTSQAFQGEGGTGTINVTGLAVCPWQATSNVSWVTITSNNTGAGTGTVSYSVAPNPVNSNRTGTITVAQQTYTITQARNGGSCYYTGLVPGQVVSGVLTTENCFATSRPTSHTNRYVFVGARDQRVLIDMGTATFDTYLGLLDHTGAVIARDDDSGPGSDSQITLTLPADGVYTIEATTFSPAATGTYRLSFRVTNHCATTITPTSQSFTGVGGNGSINITAAASCLWTANADVSWINFTSSRSGFGNASLSFTVAPNPTTSPRTAVVGVAGQSFTVSQGGCASVASVNQAFDGTGGAGGVDVTALCSWTATSNNSFIVITNGSGSGNGRATFTVAPNPTASPRFGTLTVAGQTVTIVQAATGATCPTIGLVPGQIVSGTLRNTDCGALGRSSAYADRYSFTGTAGQAVVLDMGPASFDTYLALIGPNGTVLVRDDDTGPGTDAQITLTLPTDGLYIIEATSYSSFATGTYSLSFKVTNHCAATITPTSQSFVAAGGAGSINITAAASCLWLAGTDASWITFTSSRSGAGNATLTFTVAPNATSQARTAVIGVAGRSFTVTQTGSPAP